jgi:hypothetical protein
LYLLHGTLVSLFWAFTSSYDVFNSNLSSCIKIFSHIKNARLHSKGRVQEE